ncbi:hypothetical protein, partial [Enterococcus faecalis]|uniref:hypothetical protein n=1 Tax=Enterococcus faecalis TaxID=1351 RepID=UPI003D6B737A
KNPFLYLTEFGGETFCMPKKASWTKKRGVAGGILEDGLGGGGFVLNEGQSSYSEVGESGS